MNKISEQWKVYEDFISENEIPFFSMGNDSVLVFRVGNGSKVYYPHLDEVYADSLGEFLRKLMNDINFYNKI